MPGTNILYAADGQILARLGEFPFSKRPIEEDETVYEIFEAHYSDKEQRNLGLSIILKPDWTMVTAQIPGGDEDDVMLAFIRGSVLLPKGTRFVLRVLPPPSPLPLDANGQDSDHADAAAGEGDGARS